MNQMLQFSEWSSLCLCRAVAMINDRPEYLSVSARHNGATSESDEVADKA